MQVQGVQPITFLDRNIICGDTLAGAEPPRLVERLAERPNEWARRLVELLECTDILTAGPARGEL